MPLNLLTLDEFDGLVGVHLVVRSPHALLHGVRGVLGVVPELALQLPRVDRLRTVLVRGVQDGGIPLRLCLSTDESLVITRPARFTVILQYQTVFTRARSPTIHESSSVHLWPVGRAECYRNASTDLPVASVLGQGNQSSPRHKIEILGLIGRHADVRLRFIRFRPRDTSF